MQAIRSNKLQNVFLDHMNPREIKPNTFENYKEKTSKKKITNCCFTTPHIKFYANKSINFN